MMADNKAPSREQMSEAQRTSLALADAAAEAEANPRDEFKPENGKPTDNGMMYGKFMVDGRKVYADGTPVKD